MSLSQPKGLYRSRNGAVCGVLKGLAEYFNLSLFWTRSIALVAILLTGFWPGVLLYFLAALVMKIDPETAGAGHPSAGSSRFRTMRRCPAVQRIGKTRDDLDRRLRNLEEILTSREQDWNERLRQGR